MGKTSGAASRGSLRVELAQAALPPGEALSGTVYLTLPQPLAGATLTVRVVGRQGLNWLMARGNGMVAHGTKVDHYTEQITLAEDTALSDGDSLYPFSLQLPDDLQHNFVYSTRAVEELQGVRVSVQYEVEASVTVAGSRSSTLDGTASFRVNPLPIAVPFGKRVDVSTEEMIKYMGLFQRGTCGVALSIDTDVLDTSSTIEADVMLYLKTPLALKFVTLALYEIVTVDRHNPIFPGTRKGSRLVCCRRVDKAAIATAPNGNSADDATVLTLRLPLSPNEISELDPLNPTMSSFYIDIAYRAVVEVKFPMVRRVKVGVPVTVIRKLVAPQELQVASVA